MVTYLKYVGGPTFSFRGLAGATAKEGSPQGRFAPWAEAQGLLSPMIAKCLISALKPPTPRETFMKWLLEARLGHRHVIGGKFQPGQDKEEQRDDEKRSWGGKEIMQGNTRHQRQPDGDDQRDPLQEAGAFV